MEQTEETHYTRDQPIWWQRSKQELHKALFVAYRKTAIVIDVLLPNGGTRRKLAKLDAIGPRGEGEEQP